MTSLHQSKVVSENLQCLVMIAKNWPNDVHFNCLGGEKSSISTFMSSMRKL
jgi:hypothetical protein